MSEVPMGANPVEVKVGEFDEGAEEAKKEVVVENPARTSTADLTRCVNWMKTTPPCACARTMPPFVSLRRCAAMTRPSTLPATFCHQVHPEGHQEGPQAPPGLYRIPPRTLS